VKCILYLVFVIPHISFLYRFFFCWSKLFSSDFTSKRGDCL